MARTCIDIAAPRETVWAVLSDANDYGDWAVGTRNAVHAHDGWPRVGAHLEYGVAAGALSAGDRTVVLESEPPRLLVLRAELGRVGAASIRLALEALNGGTRVVMDENPVEGVIDGQHKRPGDDALKRRNDEALVRLKRLVESRA